PEGMEPEVWNDTLLEGVTPGTPFYFVHSCYVVPDSQDTVLCESMYGDTRFCSGSKVDNIVAFQFHPERSGEDGLTMYKNFAAFSRK
ncbi:hypothetical protein OAN24_01055, partial [Pseudodesulfovibrio sp.]|nr:hypothetical protein [Pseudodesulfovibrio sp.]